jgi:hypothetical protein
LNVVADSLLHPLIKKRKEFRIMDELVHIAIEQDPEESVVKFFVMHFHKFFESFCQVSLVDANPPSAFSLRFFLSPVVSCLGS